MIKKLEPPRVLGHQNHANYGTTQEAVDKLTAKLNEIIGVVKVLIDHHPELHETLRHATFLRQGAHQAAKQATSLCSKTMHFHGELVSTATFKPPIAPSK